MNEEEPSALISRMEQRQTLLVKKKTFPGVKSKAIHRNSLFFTTKYKKLTLTSDKT